MNGNTFKDFKVVSKGRRHEIITFTLIEAKVVCILNLSFLFIAININVFCGNCFVTSRELSNNHLEEMPPVLFSNTSNLRELYV